MAQKTPLERRREARAAAMPQVKSLCRKYGRSNIMHCVIQIKEHEKSLKKLSELKREVARLEQKL